MKIILLFLLLFFNIATAQEPTTRKDSLKGSLRFERTCYNVLRYDLNIKVCTVQFGNAPTAFQKNVTKCPKTGIPSYNHLMQKVSNLLLKKSNKNTNLTPLITQKL